MAGSFGDDLRRWADAHGFEVDDDATIEVCIGQPVCDGSYPDEGTCPHCVSVSVHDDRPRDVIIAEATKRH